MATKNDSQPVSISVEPSNPLIDDRLAIQIGGLSPNQDITVHLRTTNDHNGSIYGSYGCFRANAEGNVNLATDECLNGTYTGIVWGNNI